MANKEIGDFTEATALADADDFVGLQSATTKRFGWDTLQDALSDDLESLRWKVLDSSLYTVLALNTSQLPVADTTLFSAYAPLRWKYAGQYYYGLSDPAAAAIALGCINVYGPPLRPGESLSELAIGVPGSTLEFEILSGNRLYIWGGPPAYVVHYRAWRYATAGTLAVQITNDTVTGVGNQGICWLNGGTGVLIADGESENDTQHTGIDYSTYRLAHQTKFSMLNGAALSNVSVQCLIVME